MKPALFTVCLLLASCAMNYEPPITYDEVLVINGSSGPVSDVLVIVGDSLKPTRCDAIGVEDICSDRFGRRKFKYQLISVNWMDVNGEQQNYSFKPDVPLSFLTPFPMRIMLDLQDDGTVIAKYSQENRYPGED